MIVHRKIINAPNRVIRLRPVSDLQKGQSGFQRHLWERWKQETIEDKDAWVIGLGDYSDSFRPTIQKKLKGVFIDDMEAHRQLDDMVDRITDQLAAEFEPFKNRVIGLLEGHHYHQTVAGLSSTQILCQKLGVPYLSFCSAIQLVIRTGHKNSFAVDIFATHGSGGSSKISSDLKQAENNLVPMWDVDIYLRGHSTKVYAVPDRPLSRISTNRGSGKPFIQERKRWIINTGGFMSAYLDQASSYVEHALLPKCALGTRDSARNPWRDGHHPPALGRRRREPLGPDHLHFDSRGKGRERCMMRCLRRQRSIALIAIRHSMITPQLAERNLALHVITQSRSVHANEPQNARHP